MIDNAQVSQLLIKILFGVKGRMKGYQVAKKIDIPEVQGKVLMTIFRLGRVGPKELSTILMKDKAQVARIIATLRQNNLIKKIDSESDQRSYFLELTKEGKQKAKTISKYHEKAVSCLLDGFSEKEKKQAENILNKMLTNLDSNQ